MWYYSIDGKQHGPLDDEALDRLVATGGVTAETYVWKDGMADWAPLGHVRSGGNPVVAAVAADAASESCTMCGKPVGADNLIELLGNRVCADCKPMAVQTLKEGASLPAKNFTAWRDGKKVVAQSKTSLPARCYKCNQPVETPPMNRKLYWHPSLYYLLIFFNIIVYAIVAMIVRKRGTLDIYVCPQHQQRRKYFMLGGWVGAGVCFALAIAGMATDVDWLIAVGFLGLLAAIITGIAGAQLARPAKIKGETIWLVGSGKEFLASLPDWPTPGQ